MMETMGRWVVGSGVVGDVGSEVTGSLHVEGHERLRKGRG